MLLIRLLLGQIKKAIGYTNQVGSHSTPAKSHVKKELGSGTNKSPSKIKKHTTLRKTKAVIKSEAPKDDGNVGNNGVYDEGEFDQIMPNSSPAISVRDSEGQILTNELQLTIKITPPMASRMIISSSIPKRSLLPRNDLSAYWLLRYVTILTE